MVEVEPGVYRPAADPSLPPGVHVPAPRPPADPISPPPPPPVNAPVGSPWAQPFVPPPQPRPHTSQVPHQPPAPAPGPRADLRHGADQPPAPPVPGPPVDLRHGADQPPAPPVPGPPVDLRHGVVQPPAPSLPGPPAPLVPPVPGPLPADLRREGEQPRPPAPAPTDLRHGVVQPLSPAPGPIYSPGPQPGPNGGMAIRPPQPGPLPSYPGPAPQPGPPGPMPQPGPMPFPPGPPYAQHNMPAPHPAPGPPGPGPAPVPQPGPGPVPGPQPGPGPMPGPVPGPGPGPGPVPTTSPQPTPDDQTGDGGFGPAVETPRQQMPWDFPPAPNQPGPPPGPNQPGPQPGPPPFPPVPSAEADPFQELNMLADATPTAEEFARRRLARPSQQSATMGTRAMLRKTTFGLLNLAPGQDELEYKKDVETVRRNFGGLRQVTVVNPKGGAGKTVAVLLLAMTFGQKRGGYVLAWDNNETQGTLGMRAQQDFHARTVRDMMRDLHLFQGAQGRVGDLSQYVRSQGEGMFDVLASDESATAGEMLTSDAFAEIRDVVSRFYKLIFVDTGNNVRAENWQAAMDATDQLVITMSARNDSAEPAARALDHLEQSGRRRLVRQAVTIVTMPPTRKDIDLQWIEQHFRARTRAVLVAPYERLLDSGEPIRYGELSNKTKEAWLKIAAAVAEGL
ncbi:MinD/ParA family protein [Actinoplanes utahensis]